MSAGAWTLLLLVLAIALAGVWLYNRLVRLRNTVAEAWAGIDVQLQRRHELVPNLVATVRGYTEYEFEVLNELTRRRNPNVDGMQALTGQETELSRGISGLFALAEDYPDLKASDTFRQLHDSLVEVENQLQYARRYYNGAVRDLNNAVESFPGNLVARAFSFESAEFFEIELASQRATPRVALDREPAQP
ncbi:MAG: LemA family protein [Xanthomonadales bacterium]|nr:LemA family protein [Xanthomonadales bacterium]